MHSFSYRMEKECDRWNQWMTRPYSSDGEAVAAMEKDQASLYSLKPASHSLKFLTFPLLAE